MPLDLDVLHEVHLAALTGGVFVGRRRQRQQVVFSVGGESVTSSPARANKGNTEGTVAGTDSAQSPLTQDHLRVRFTDFLLMPVYGADGRS